MASGLEGVVAAETVLSHADGERGIIRVRGRTIGDLVALGYEGAIALLWDGLRRREADARRHHRRARGGPRACVLAARRVVADGLTAASRSKACGSCSRRCRTTSTPAQIAAALPVGIAALIRSL